MEGSISKCLWEALWESWDLDNVMGVNRGLKRRHGKGRWYKCLKEAFWEKECVKNVN